MNLNIKALWNSQNLNFWQKLRTPLLAITFVSVVSLVGKTILTPTKTSRQITSSTFPQVVPLPGWQFVQSGPLTPQADGESGRRVAAASGRDYQYSRNTLPLDIEIRDADALIGDIPTLTRHYTSIELTKALFQQRQQPGVGFHGLFVYQGRAYLSACVNRRGNSTVTRRQFVQNQITHNIRPERFLPVLLSSESLYDRRCLLTQLSIPLNSASPASAYQTLEKTWISWYQWWRTNVPRF